jgi:hypothetical protein
LPSFLIILIISKILKMARLSKTIVPLISSSDFKLRRLN